MTVLEAVLWPASLMFEAVVRARAWCYRRGVFRQRRLDAVVISVGNLTVGGTGKTPMTLWLAQRLSQQEKRVGILTRGYRPLGQRNVRHGKDRADNALQSGGSDEAALLTRRLGEQIPIGIGADRWRRGRELEARGIDWLILDDGFAHLRLARDVDVVLIDSTQPFGGGFLLPAGRLREPKSALARADIIVITRSEHAPAVEAMVRRHSAAPIFYAQTELESIYPASATNGEEDESLFGAREQKYFAFCGIGNPEVFFDDLRRWGMQTVGHRFFHDHHRYSQLDVDNLEQQAGALHADAMIATEKDFFNLVGTQRRILPLFLCRIGLRITNEDAFLETILAIAERRRARSST